MAQLFLSDILTQRKVPVSIGIVWCILKLKNIDVIYDVWSLTSISDQFQQMASLMEYFDPSNRGVITFEDFYRGVTAITELQQQQG